MNEKQRTLLIIEEFASNLTEPKRDMSKENFKMASYSWWAIGEIARRIEDSGSVDPIETIRKFETQMREYSLMSPRSYSMFTVASGIVRELLEIFNAMK